MAPRPDDQASLRLTQRYDAEASAYRDYWAPVILPIASRMVEALPAHSARCVLDVGTGVGQLLPVLRRKFDGALVVGVDRSEGMLSLSPRGDPVVLADACCSCFADAQFDVIAMAFMLFHLPDPGAGLREAMRVLRPGGLVGLATWAADLDSRATQVWNEELDAHGAVPPEALRRIAQHELMDTPEKVQGLLEAAGFVSVSAEVVEFTHTMALEQFILLRTSVGSTGQRLESMEEEKRNRCVTRARERLSELAPDDFTMRMQIVFARARSPFGAGRSEVRP